MPGRYPLSLLTLTPRPARVGRACYRPAMSDHAIDPLDLEALVTEARALYAARRPQSRREHEAARVHLPGGNTRSVLHFEPFPYRVVGADGAVQTDADGHTYIDLCGNYTAGLFGHSASAVRAAVVAALDTGFSIGGIRAQEAELAGLLCRRFPSLEQVRFTNSGTEANLLCTITLQQLPFEEYLLRWQMIDQDTRLQIFKKDRTGGEDIALTVGNPILEEIDEFADCIRTGKTPETDGYGGLQALAFIRAAIESARTGKQVGISI